MSNKWNEWVYCGVVIWKDNLRVASSATINPKQI